MQCCVYNVYTRSRTFLLLPHPDPDPDLILTRYYTNISCHKLSEGVERSGMLHVQQCYNKSKVFGFELF